MKSAQQMDTQMCSSMCRKHEVTTHSTSNVGQRMGGARGRTVTGGLTNAIKDVIQVAFLLILFTLVIIVCIIVIRPEDVLGAALEEELRLHLRVRVAVLKLLDCDVVVTRTARACTVHRPAYERMNTSAVTVKVPAGHLRHGDKQRASPTLPHMQEHA